MGLNIWDQLWKVKDYSMHKRGDPFPETLSEHIKKQFEEINDFESFEREEEEETFQKEYIFTGHEIKGQMIIKHYIVEITRLKQKFGEDFVLVTVKDVTSHQVIWESQNQDRLKMQIMQSFLHELRTPLNGIVSCR